jgi:hypothetical protein
MRKKIVIIFLVFFIPLISFSQSDNSYNLDFGLKLGVSNYIGDIGGDDKKAQAFVLDMKMQETRWSIGGYARYKIGKPDAVKTPWSVEVQLNWIRISGADSLTKNYSPRKIRNLTFRNDIVQLNMMGEWSFFESANLGKDDNSEKNLSAYGCTGLSIFYQDPYAYNPYHYLGLPTWVSLHGLRTEAQLYSGSFHLIQPGIPFGAGVNYTFKKKYRIGWSITWTKTFTDYLDGISGNYPSQAQWNSLTPEEKYFSSRIASLPDVDPAPNGLRGNSLGHDSFITSTINVGYIIQYHTVKELPSSKEIMMKESSAKY